MNRTKGVTGTSSEAWIRHQARHLAGACLVLWLGGCSTSHLRVRGPVVMPVNDEVSSFESSGHSIRVDVYRPESPGRHPAAILLHGSSGIHALVPSTVNRYAEVLAQEGIVALVVHYFDATGDASANDSVEVASYFRWVDTLRDAVTWARQRPYVNPRKVGLLGHSLGAWLAVGAAAFDSRIDRIVLFGAGLEPFLADKIKRMPPTLMFHGEKDDVVPLAEANHLADFLRAHEFPVKLYVYRGEGHTFADSAATEALANAGRFLGSKAALTKR